jgi:tetratricopeptide (TPR) repeat protein
VILVTLTVVSIGMAWLAMSAGTSSPPLADTTVSSPATGKLPPVELPGAPCLLPDASSNPTPSPATPMGSRQASFPAKADPAEGPAIFSPELPAVESSEAAATPVAAEPCPVPRHEGDSPIFAAETRVDGTTSDGPRKSGQSPTGESLSDDASPVPSYTPLLTPFDPRERSRQLEEVAREADVHTRRGFELAGRGARYSARAEFVQALRLVAEGLDAEHHGVTHGRALADGLAALDEAEDFVPRGSHLEADLDLRSIVAGHHTPVLKDAAIDGVTPMAAVHRYLTFAQQQLAAAAGAEVAGSMALHALGKLDAWLALREQPDARIAGPRAMACYQAALLVCRKNYMASNDLGVLLARQARPEEARAALEHSLSVHPSATTWENLAAVYRQLGNGDLADRAEKLARATSREEKERLAAEGVGSGSRAKWVDPNQFAESYAKVPDPHRPPPTPRAAPAGEANPSRPASPQQAERSWPWNLLDNTRK